MSDCRDIQDKLELYAQDDLPPDERARLAAHLEKCAACGAALRDARALVDALDGLLQSPRARPGFRDRLRRRPRKFGWTLPIAAAVLVALAVTFLLRPTPPRLAGRLMVRADSVYTILAPDRVRLDSGEIFVDVDGPFTVETPAGTALAKGTRFYVESKPEGGSMRALTTVLILTGIVQLQNPHGTVEGRRGEVIGATQDAAPKKHVEDLAARFAKFYEPVEVKAKPSIPAYALPLDFAKVSNFDAVSKKLGLAADEPLLKRNGFVVIPMPRGLGGRKGDDIVAPYKELKEAEIPVFVTADTLLHLYHVQFDESLKDIEEREFYGDVVALAEMLVAGLADQPKALTYACVGLKHLKPDFEVPAAVKADVEVVLDKMSKHEGFWPDPKTAHQEWPLFRYSEDWSQYVPRGHYTRSENLKRYFMGMMWFGRMTFILKGGVPFGPGNEPFLVSGDEAKAQCVAAAAITKLLDGGKLADGRAARDVWERIYGVTSFYVGLADDLGMQEYREALSNVAGAALDLSVLSDAGALKAFQLGLAKHQPPAIYGGTGGLIGGPTSDPEDLLKALGKTTGFRLMGQRFIPDSYVMGKLVYPSVGSATNGRTDMFTSVEGMRAFPRGLDVMALLGSKRAAELLHELGDDAYGTQDAERNVKYAVAFAALKKEFDAMTDADWNRNLYWSWLHALKPLTAEFGEGYPTFMTTKAWRDKSLSTALGSWAQLRHDTILYAKQSYTMEKGGAPKPPEPVAGYVEPVPEFYARLLALNRMTLKGLTEMKVLAEPAVERLRKLDEILAKLLAIAEKEIADQKLSEEENAFIRGFGEALEGVRVKYPDLKKAYDEAIKANDWDKAEKIREQMDGDKSMMTTLIADVHTDQNSQKVLEEGTGQVDLAVVCYLQPGGRLLIGAGPVLSYYEFKHPMADRLTDEKWVDLLKGDQAPARPEWTSNFRRK